MICWQFDLKNSIYLEKANTCIFSALKLVQHK